jgi:hypothetical protein
MAIVVIGGQSRHVGKSSVVAGIISALPQYRWTAIKISQHRHGVPEAWSVSQELDRDGSSDSARFLRAGAERAFLVRADPGHLREAMPAVREKFAQNVIIESNSVTEFLQPGAFLMVVDAAVEDCKDSARKFVERADAVVAHRGIVPAWVGEARRVFAIEPPQYVTDEMVEFVMARCRP